MSKVTSWTAKLLHKSTIVEECIVIDTNILVPDIPIAKKSGGTNREDLLNIFVDGIYGSIQESTSSVG